MKKCFKCGEEKPLTAFYKHKNTTDGHLGKCKECTKKDVRQNRKEKIDYYREYDVDRYAANQERRKAQYGYVVEWRKKFPIKYRAHNVVHAAIRDKKIERGVKCECCGDIKNLHAHHDDYAKPLEVRWLCPSCHHEWHSKNGEGLNAS